MKICDVLHQVKKNYKGSVDIESGNTRDKILYGDNIDIECTGIVTTQWASVDVIRKAIDLGYNLIICHEALFWNHGDHTDWLQNNSTYKEKKQLLDKGNIVVWRNHDYVHSGILMNDGSYKDGIFYAFAKKMKWENNIIGDIEKVRMFEIEEETVEDIGKKMIDALSLNGLKIIGSLHSKVKRICIPPHNLGEAKDTIKKAEKENIDLFIAMELIDFNLSEYIRDSSQLNKNKAILTAGHFNTEEPGMEYMADYLNERLDGIAPCIYIKSGDMYKYMT